MDPQVFLERILLVLVDGDKTVWSEAMCNVHPGASNHQNQEHQMVPKFQSKRGRQTLHRACDLL